MLLNRAPTLHRLGPAGLRARAWSTARPSGCRRWPAPLQRRLRRRPDGGRTCRCPPAAQAEARRAAVVGPPPRCRRPPARRPRARARTWCWGCYYLTQAEPDPRAAARASPSPSPRRRSSPTRRTRLACARRSRCALPWATDPDRPPVGRCSPTTAGRCILNHGARQPGPAAGPALAARPDRRRADQGRGWRSWSPAPGPKGARSWPSTTLDALAAAGFTWATAAGRTFSLADLTALATPTVRQRRDAAIRRPGGGRSAGRTGSGTVSARSPSGRPPRPGSGRRWIGSWRRCRRAHPTTRQTRCTRSSASSPAGRAATPISCAGCCLAVGLLGGLPGILRRP